MMTANDEGVITIATSKRLASASCSIVTVRDPSADVVRCQAMADEHLADARGTLHDLADKLIDAELWPEDSEIVAGILGMFMATWGLDEAQTKARMPHFDWAKAVEA